jgi:2-phospho-L-lactate guanylyltransferase
MRKPWAAVPIKTVRDAKQRLAPALDAHERQMLFRAMLEDVLRVLVGVEWLAGVLVVTRDAEVQRLAERLGASILNEADSQGQTSAVTAAARALRDRTDTMLSVPADLPLVSAADLGAMWQLHATMPSVTLAPAHDRRGTNAVICSPPDVLAFQFGTDSFAPHLGAARACGIEPRIIERRGLGLDVDSPEDLRMFLAEPSDTLAYHWLQASGVAARLVPPRG